MHELRCSAPIGCALPHESRREPSILKERNAHQRWRLEGVSYQWIFKRCSTRSQILIFGHSSDPRTTIMRVGLATSAVQRGLVVCIGDWNNRVTDASTRVDPYGLLHCASPYFDTASREAVVTNLIQSLVGLLVSGMCCKHWGSHRPMKLSIVQRAHH